MHENEKCIRCGKQTTIPKWTPVFQRRNYIEGAGQLCDKCFIEVFGNAIERKEKVYENLRKDTSE